jgi:hypothetical protein
VGFRQSRIQSGQPLIRGLRLRIAALRERPLSALEFRSLDIAAGRLGKQSGGAQK